MVALSRRSSLAGQAGTVSGVRRCVALASLAGSAAVCGTLGIAAVPAPVQAAPGNNGTIKIDGFNPDHSPKNHPHVGCHFMVEWFNFDPTQVTSHVSFAAQSPTSSAWFTVSGDTSPTFTGGKGFDHADAYTLTPHGAPPQPQQGYHVKVTVTTPYSKGNDTKSKVFWFDCVPAHTPPPTPTPPPSGGGHDHDHHHGHSHGHGHGSGAHLTAPSVPERPAPVAAPTRIDSGLAGTPIASTRPAPDRWPLFALSALSAAFGGGGLYLRRRGARRS